MQFNTLLITDISDGSTMHAFDTIAEGMYTAFRVTCYSDAAATTPVNASAGTALITATDDSFNYGSVQDAGDTDGLVDLTISDYDRPYMTGFIDGFKVTLSGVSGCAAIKVIAVTSKA